ncbi:MAG: hypothetical protein VZR09_03360 [Candidatus Gastranaerophilaceae bacterium]|nr:hypothetical protein [Candidatus Gastranaerophilaceae bacterium]
MLSYEVNRAIKERIAFNLIQALQNIHGVESWRVSNWKSQYQQYPEKVIADIKKAITEITKKQI